MTLLITVHGLLLPEETLRAPWFGVFAAFVAMNTVVYVALSIAKALPKLYVHDWLPRRHHRAETRSIHPDGPL